MKDLDTGAQRRLACDLVVFTADWIPDHELAVLGGIDLDEGTRGPRVGPGQHTTRPGVFAAGNLLHGAETADIAALSGHHVTEGVIAHLDGQPWPSPPIPIQCAEPLHWIAPNALTPPQDRAPARGRFLLRARRELIWPRIEITQDGRRLWSGRLPRVMPGRSAALRTRWMTAVDPAAGTVTVRVLRARRAATMTRGAAACKARSSRDVAGESRVRTQVVYGAQAQKASSACWSLLTSQNSWASPSSPSRNTATCEVSISRPSSR